jgi:hypothetical protein
MTLQIVCIVLGVIALGFACTPIGEKESRHCIPCTIAGVLLIAGGVIPLFWR